MIRYTYHYPGAYSNEIAPYLHGEELQIPQMTGNHWYDTTADHTLVSDVDIPMRKVIARRMDLAICMSGIMIDGYRYIMGW